MPKFNKDQIQKMVLSGILFIFLIYAYFSYGLGPLSKKDEVNRKAIEEMQTRIDAAQQQIRKASNARSNAASAVTTMQTINGMIPHEAPIAWLPPLLTDFFAREGVDNVSIKPLRTDNVNAEGLGDFKYFNWSIDSQSTPFLKIAGALSNLENSQPLISIRTIRMEADPGNPEQQKFYCEIKALLK